MSRGQGQGHMVGTGGGGVKDTRVGGGGQGDRGEGE